jgi:hypothetical protein
MIEVVNDVSSVPNTRAHLEKMYFFFFHDQNT